MIGFKDRTWCPNHVSDRCALRKGCYRVFTPEDQADAEKWWGGPDFPISQFVGEPSCFRPAPNQEQEPDGSK